MKRNPLIALSDARLEKLASDLRMRSDEIDVRLDIKRRVLEVRHKPNVISGYILEMIHEFCQRRGFLYAVFAFPVAPVVDHESVNLTIEIC